MNNNYLRKELYDLIKSDDTIFDFLQNSFADGLWYWDLEKPENEWMNDKFWLTFGINPATKMCKSSEWQEIIHKDDLDVAIKNFNRHIENPSYPYDQIVRYKHSSGKTVWIRCRGIAIRNHQGRPIRMLGGHNDITDLKELEIQLRNRNNELNELVHQIAQLNKQLITKVSTDPLTGAYNRYFVDELVQIEINKTKRAKIKFCILMIDINYFKEINDSYGHIVGDRVLIDFVDKVKKIVRAHDVLSRWGGDEFLVFLPNTEIKMAKEIGRRIREYLVDNPYNNYITHSIAMGISEYRSNETLEEFINRTDQAMYENKKIIKNI